MNKSIAISPSVVLQKKMEQIPNEVIEIFNQLIINNFDGNQAVVKQSDALKLIKDKLNISREEILNRHYLDVEPLYKSKGWDVEYDKPAYNESYDAKFIFTVKL